MSQVMIPINSKEAERLRTALETLKSQVTNIPSDSSKRANEILEDFKKQMSLRIELFKAMLTVGTATSAEGIAYQVEGLAGMLRQALATFNAPASTASNEVRGEIESLSSPLTDVVSAVRTLIEAG